MQQMTQKKLVDRGEPHLCDHAEIQACGSACGCCCCRWADRTRRCAPACRRCCGVARRRLPDLRVIGAELDEPVRRAHRSRWCARKANTLAVGFLSDCIDEACAAGRGRPDRGRDSPAGRAAVRPVHAGRRVLSGLYGGRTRKPDRPHRGAEKRPARMGAAAPDAS